MASPHAPSHPAAPPTVSVRLEVNGRPRELQIDVRTTLLDALREHLDLTGTKKGCDHGQCGACTVLLEDRRVNACLVLAVACDGATVRTVEGLGTPGDLHPVQQSFLDHDGFQCGYCTPGQIVSAVGMLGEYGQGWPSAVTTGRSPGALDAAEVRERMSGNLCRCGAYLGIVAAILDAAPPAGRSSITPADSRTEGSPA